MREDYMLVTSMLPQRIKSVLQDINNSLINDVSEIRLRAGKPLALTVKNKNIYPEEKGYGYIPSCRNIVLTADELENALFMLCGNSVYSHEYELAEGFVSLPGGHRAGVCGTAVTRADGTLWVRNISSINIRIAGQRNGFANKLMQLQNCGGLLICGAPHTGKTTLLRDYIRQCSNMGEKIAVIDCRGEIAASESGICGMDVGVNTDVISGGRKKDGIENALRSMAPDTIAFDEIGSTEELNAITDCMNSGVRTVTTVHAGSVKELLQRNNYLPVLNTGAFSHIVFINKDFEYKIMELGDIYAKVNLRVNNNGHMLCMRNKKSVGTCATG